MTPAPTPPPPGSMTVPPLFGWDDVALVLTVVLVVAVTAFVLLAAGRNASARSEWQAWLDSRSSRGPDPAGEEHRDAETTAGPGTSR